ncbi:glucokinase [soil metagenome]
MDKQATNQGNSIGVDVSSTRFLAVAIAPDGTQSEIIESQHDDALESLPQLKEFVASIEGRLGRYGALGISMPGLVHRATGRVTYSAGFPEHAQFDIAKEIKDAAGISPAIENDANAAIYGEFRLGAGRGANDLFYATIGTGVGGAFIFRGELWRGTSGFAGEFGYMAINSDGMRLEDVASSSNIVRRTQSRFHQDSTTALAKFEEKDLTIGEIVKAAINEDDFAALMLERTGRYVGVAIASVINLLNIERIVLGGEIIKAGDLILEPIRDRAKELSFGPSFHDAEIVAGELGDAASALGVALIARET